MEILKNQTVYQCSFCKKRLLSRNGAKLHENEYCWHPESPNQQNIRKKQETCSHKNKHTLYSYIPGETVQQPDHDVCIDCGKHI